MFVEPDKEEEHEPEETEASPKASSGGKGPLVITIVLAVLLAGAAGGAGYLFTQWNKTKQELARTQSSLQDEKDNVQTLEGEKAALIEQKTAVETELTNTKTALQTAGQQIQELTTAKDQALASLAEKEEKEKTLSAQLAKIEKELASVSKVKEDLETRFTKTKEELEKAAGKADETKTLAERLDAMVKDAQAKADLAAAVQAEIDKMLGKAEASQLVRGKVSSVNSLERLVVIDTGDKPAAPGKHFVISDDKNEWLATVAVEKVDGQLNVARVLRPIGEVKAEVGDVAIEVPEVALTRQFETPGKKGADKPKKASK